MLRGNCRSAVLLALLLALALSGVICPAAPAESADALLRVRVAVSPEGLLEPGSVTLRFTLENVSQEEARNVCLSSADGLLIEQLGQIAPGASRSFSLQHSVSARELEDGAVNYIVSYDDPDDAAVKRNYGVRAEIRRGDVQPDVEFTRQFSRREVEAGGTVRVSYRVYNSGNTPLSELVVRDSLGDFQGRIDALAAGESRTLLHRVALTETDSSSAELSYRVEGEEEPRSRRLADVEIRVVEAKLEIGFTATYSAFSRSNADVVLTLRNSGTSAYRGLCVTDALYGGVIADGLCLPADGSTLEIRRTCPIRGDRGFCWRVTGVSDSGAAVELQTETLFLAPQTLGSPDALQLSVTALTPRIRKAGNVPLRVAIQNAGGMELRDLTLSEASLGVLHSFAILPADGAITRDFTIAVEESASYNFSLRGTAGDGTVVTAAAAPVEIIIASDGVLPEGAEEHFLEFSGGSIKIGGSSTFAVLLLTGCALLLLLIVALIIANHRARVKREKQTAAERDRLREELERTGRVPKLRADKKTGKKGRNS